jgi:uncharacterized protein
VAVAVTRTTDRSSPAFVRRRDRAVDDDAWIRVFLRRAPMGVLATVDHAGRPFVNSNLFVYDQAADAIYMHTARLGRTWTNVQRQARVCFSATEMGRLLPAKEALEFSVEYASVVVFGRGRVVSDEAEAAQALQMLLDKYAPHLRPGHDYRPPVPAELARTAVYRIDIEVWSGKRKRAAEDFPGAYTYAPPAP